MDKTEFETYQFLTENTETDTDQFFVVQEDGTFLINRPIQYVETQNGKEVLDNVEVYDVTPQQFYVDVNSSAELISVSDQLVLADATENLYSNNYVLPSSPTEQMEQDVVMEQDKQNDMLLEINGGMVLDNNHQESFAEITITDEQVQMLQEKGWILLEANDKIFMLDTLGLHDITSNEKLIQKLKNEVQANLDVESKSEVKESIPAYNNNLPEEHLEDSDNYAELVKDEHVESDNYAVENKYLPAEQLRTECNQAEEEKVDAIEPEIEQPVEVEGNKSPVKFVVNPKKKKQNCINIKTSFIFKDVPSKIILGKTVNGKNLVAKLVKNSNKFSNVPKTVNNSDKGSDQGEAIKKSVADSYYLDEIQLKSLIRQALQDGLENTPEQVQTAKKAVLHLLNAPTFKQSVMENELFITLVTKHEELSGAISSVTIPVLMTGQVALVDNKPSFLYLPDMLSDITSREQNGVSLLNRNYQFLHVHILEVKRNNEVVCTSVSIDKRSFPLQNILAVKRRHPSAIFACSACAALFQSESELEDHQQSQCTQYENKLYIDMEVANKPEDLYIVKETSNGKIFVCTNCNQIFDKHNNCLRHIKTHMNSNLEEESPTKMKNGKGAIYKCRMCSSLYHNRATLTKHIVSTHIKMNTQQSLLKSKQ